MVDHISADYSSTIAELDGDFGYSPPLSLAHHLRDTYRYFSKALLYHISKHGITMAQYYILKELWQEDGLTQRQLSERIGIMEPTAARTLKNMRNRGYIRRERNSQDRRKTNISLTETGISFFREIFPFAMKVNADAVKGIPEEKLQLFRSMLDQMKNNLEQATDESGSPPLTK